MEKIKYIKVDKSGEQIRKEAAQIVNKMSKKAKAAREAEIKRASKEADKSKFGNHYFVRYFADGHYVDGEEANTLQEARDIENLILDRNAYGKIIITKGKRKVSESNFG